MISELYNAAPYIDQFQDSVFVIKAGGEILLDPKRLAQLVRQIYVLWQVGIHPVVVHGGGPQLDAALIEAGHTPQKIDGRRVTDERTLDLAKRTFHGVANIDFVAAMVKAGLPCVGMSGVDGQTLLLRKRPPVEVGGERVDFGLVGDPVAVKADLLRVLIAKDFVPVICSLGVDSEGQVLNVNADTMACEIAVALNAAKLFFVTDKPGILHDVNDPSSIYSVLDMAELESLVQQKVIAGGMLPKIKAAVSALKRGVLGVHVIGVEERDALLEETFTNQGCGTMLVLKKEAKV